MKLHRRFLLAGVAALAAGPALAQERPYRITIRRNLGCGCCEAWERHLRESGRFDTSMTEDVALRDYKRRLGVPRDLSSCHTAEVEGYVIEGHVPAQDILRLIAERPEGVRGLAVPDMPVGSPGMEMGTSRDAYEVIAFYVDGSRSVWARYDQVL